MKNIVKLPNTVDIEINGVCNLNCAWCWGPAHISEIETVSNKQWKEIIQKLKSYGTKSIIFTGGETLLRKDLGELLADTKKQNMRVTLSTNGILLNLLKPILQYVDDLGLPIDGHDHASNSIMRVSANPNMRHIDFVLNSIKYVQDNHPEVNLTVRTVVTAKNYKSVPKIGKTLIDKGINPLKLRWKLYQVSPEGPRHDTTVNGGWMISNDLFTETEKAVRNANPEFKNIKFQQVEVSIRRYLLLDPSGKAFVLGPDNDGNPTQIPAGNVVGDFEGFIDEVSAHNYFPVDQTHGV
mgnify:CR=1 FL=1